MPCTCNQNFTGSASDLYNEIATQIQQNKGTITGDASSGSFTVPVLFSHIEGTYTIAGQQLTVQITKTGPVGCNAICNYLKSHIQ
jgi:hypothetical protein